MQQIRSNCPTMSASRSSPAAWAVYLLLGLRLLMPQKVGSLVCMLLVCSCEHAGHGGTPAVPSQSFYIAGRDLEFNVEYPAMASIMPLSMALADFLPWWGT